MKRITLNTDFMKHRIKGASFFNSTKNCLLKLRAIYFYPIINLSILLFSCSSNYISRDYDHSQIFTEYRTYNFMNNTETNLSDLLAKDTALYNTIKFTVDKALSKKGFKLVESGKPDFVVFIHSNKSKEDSSYNFHPWWQPCGFTSVSSYEDNSLVIDILDKGTELIWRGLAAGFFNTHQNIKIEVKEIDDVVSLILDSFPPN